MRLLPGSQIGQYRTKPCYRQSPRRVSAFARPRISLLPCRSRLEPSVRIETSAARNEYDSGENSGTDSRYAHEKCDYYQDHRLDSIGRNHVTGNLLGELVPLTW